MIQLELVYNDLKVLDLVLCILAQMADSMPVKVV